MSEPQTLPCRSSQWRMWHVCHLGPALDHYSPPKLHFGITQGAFPYFWWPDHPLGQLDWNLWGGTTQLCFHSSSGDSHVNPRLRTTVLVALLLQIWSVDQQHGPHLGACYKYRILALPQTYCTRTCIFRRSSHNSYCPSRQPDNNFSEEGKKAIYIFCLNMTD